MRDSSVETTTFYSATHILLSSPQMAWFYMKVDQAVDVLRTDHSAVNGIEWYVQTLNDALQTQCAVLRFVM
ncbi:hypothetical protein TNCV_4233361 [Trichonephila clavipes]|nr:hypothetical protein TNCV_4233361 [Trichonephila clavipes]